VTLYYAKINKKEKTGLGATAFHGPQKITLNGGQEMMIRITR